MKSDRDFLMRRYFHRATSYRALQSLLIASDGLDLSQRTRYGFHDGLQHVVLHFPNAVMHPGTISARLDQTRTPQVRQVSRSRWLGNVERLMNMTDAHLVCSQQRENTKANGVGQRTQCGIHLD